MLTSKGTSDFARAFFYALSRSAHTSSVIIAEIAVPDPNANRPALAANRGIGAGSCINAALKNCRLLVLNVTRPADLFQYMAPPKEPKEPK